ncbi:phosphoglycerate mutase-like protein [Jackrogersella minutella]|nr:phosphoglycerate mutase-like protein [Jackrogersella minutella]
MAPTIDIIRHAIAEHNVLGSELPDPGITVTGRRQLAVMQTRYLWGDDVVSIVSSPLKRAVDTAVFGIIPLVKDGMRIDLIPELQEINATPSSTGTSARELLETYSYINFDASALGEEWYLKGPDTPFAPDVAKVERRARKVRGLLRRIASRAAERGETDARIVVVTHGEFAHWLTEDFVGTGYHRNSGWANTEIRSYQFADLGAPDSEDVPLVETAASMERRRADPTTAVTALTDDERARQKSIAAMRVQYYARDYDDRRRRMREAPGPVAGKAEEDEEDWEDEDDDDIW